jgi:uncharacterized membrane protein YadS
VGAGLMMSHETGDVAVIVKLFRVTLLVPVVAVLAWYWRRRSHAGDAGPRTPLLPFFLVGFMVLVLANSLGVVTPRLNEALGHVSRACLVVAISALGIKTSFEALVQLGWRPMALMLLETLWLVAVFAVYLCIVR